MKAHPEADFDRRLAEGASVYSVAKSFGCARAVVARHMTHLSKLLKDAAKARSEKVGLDLLECQTVVWKKAMDASDMALGRVPTPEAANLAVFGSCIAPATKLIEVMAKIDDKPNVPIQNTTINFSKFTDEELKAYELLGRKLEGSEEGASEKTSN